MNRMHNCRLRDVKLARGHTFVWCDSLRGSMVIDAGAHRCEFAHILASKYGARVIALEPNNTLSADHSHKEVRLLRSALADADGQGALFIGDNLEASSIIHEDASDAGGSVGVPCEFRSVRSLIAEFNIDRIGLLKLDIEGAEFDVIKSIDKELAHLIDQITIEFHPAAPRGKEFLPIDEAISHLKSLDFQMFRSSHTGYGDVLFLNSRNIKMPGKLFGVALPYYRKALEIYFER